MCVDAALDLEHSRRPTADEVIERAMPDELRLMDSDLLLGHDCHGQGDTHSVECLMHLRVPIQAIVNIS